MTRDTGDGPFAASTPLRLFTAAGEPLNLPAMRPLRAPLFAGAGGGLSPWPPLTLDGTPAAPQLPAAAGIGAALAEFGRVLAEALRPLLDWAVKMFHSASRMFFPGQHRRCWTCHPARKPKPLAVDGHEYQRRLRTRRKRRRR